jgi:hypothetical protein
MSPAKRSGKKPPPGPKRGRSRRSKKAAKGRKNVSDRNRPPAGRRRED